MLIIFDDVDKSGKTTLSKLLAEELNIPYVKLNNISVKENESINLGISISTHSQLETFTQLYEQGVIKNAILDRFHGSEIVYSNLFLRPYGISYIKDIEKRLSRNNDVILIRTRRPQAVLNKLWKSEEKLLNMELLPKLLEEYDNFYKNTKLNVIEIEVSNSIDITFAALLSKLNNHGIYSGHLRKERISHTKAMMGVAKTMSKRSPCITRQVGCVITENGFIVGVGYNGPPSGLKHDITDIRKEKGFKSGEGLDYSRDVHAEQNAIMQSGLRSKQNGNLELFTTSSPCIHCMRMIIQMGIKKIVYDEKYDHQLAWDMAEEAGIEMIKYMGH